MDQCDDAPKGEKRAANVIGNAIHAMRIATGRSRRMSAGRPKGARGRTDGTAPAVSLAARQRSAIPSSRTLISVRACLKGPEDGGSRRVKT
jgi:hypothetical protein